MSRRPAPLHQGAERRAHAPSPAWTGGGRPGAVAAAGALSVRPGGSSGSRRGGPGRPGAAPRRSSSRRTSRRAAVTALVVLAVLAGAGWALLWSPLTRVSEVSVSGASRTPAAAVAGAAQPQLGTPLLRWDADAVAVRLRDQPYVASVSLTRGWPDRVEVVVTERVPVAAVPREQGGVSVVDADGAVITQAPRAPDGLPVVEVTGPAGPRAVEAASRVARSLPAALRADVLSVGASGPDDVVLRLRQGAQVRWGGAGSPRGKAGVLALLRREAPDVGGYDVSAPSAPATWPKDVPGAPADRGAAPPPGPADAGGENAAPQD